MNTQETKSANNNDWKTTFERRVIDQMISDSHGKRALLEYGKQIDNSIENYGSAKELLEMWYDFLGLCQCWFVRNIPSTANFVERQDINLLNEDFDQVEKNARKIFVDSILKSAGPGSVLSYEDESKVSSFFDELPSRFQKQLCHNTLIGF